MSCPVSDVLVQLGRGVRMGKCPWSLARHRSRTGAGTRAAGLGLGLGALSGRSGQTQTQGAGSNTFPRSAWEEVQGLPEKSTL